jgi:hypothetical protein
MSSCILLDDTLKSGRIRRVPHIPLGEMWDEKDGQPGFPVRGTTHIRLCGFL